MLKHTLARCSLVTLLGTLACGEKKEAPSMQPAPAAPAPAAPAPAPAAPAAPAAQGAAVPAPSTEPAKPDEAGVVHLTATDQMRYSATRIEAKAGKVKIELK